MTWSFFREQKNKKSNSRRRAKAAGRRRPLFEPLETRNMLAVLTVNTDSDVVAADNVLTLREAVSVVNTGSTAGLTAAELAQVNLTNPLGTDDTVQFDAAFFAVPRTTTLAGGAGDIDIEAGVTINGPGAANLEITDNAGTPSRIFNITSDAGDVTIKGLELTGGTVAAGFFGGAISSESISLLTVADSVLTGNAAGAGGAIYTAGDLTILNSTIGGAGALANTAAAGGGGIFTYLNTATVTVKNSTITGNTAVANGGGISTYGDVVVENSTISNNKTTGAGTWGGGIYAGTVALQNSTVSGNEAADDGGGIYAGPGTFGSGTGVVTIKNSTVSGNNSGGQGGGVFAQGNVSVEKSTIGGATANTSDSDGGGIFGARAVTVTQSTISGNEAAGGASDGGGIYANGTLILRHSTVSGNKADDDGGGVYGFTVVIQNSTITGNRADADNSTVGTGGGAYVFTAFRMTNSIVVGNTDDGNGFPDLDIPAGSTVRASLIGDNTGLPAEAQFTVMGPLAKNASGNFIGMPGGANAIPVTAPAGTPSAFGSGAGAGTLATNGGPTQTIALTTDSIAIDMGRNNLVVNPNLGDQRGLPFVRRFNGVVDMGAFEFQTVALNTPPVVANPIPDQTAIVGNPFVFTFAANAFTDADLDPLTYTATLSGGGALPGWLTFTQNTNGRTFVGVPTAADIGAINIDVTASDGKGGFVSDTFTLTVVAAELPFTEDFNAAPLNPRILERTPSITRSTSGPIEGAGSLRAERQTVGSRPLATVEFASPATPPTITNVKVNVSTETGNGGTLWSNALVTFDFQDNNNYKFAGVFEIIDRLIIGQVVNGQVQYLKQAVFPAAPNTTIPLDVSINRTTRQVTLTSGTTSIAHTFAALGNGTVGVGTINANARFDNLQIT
jgi:hypothetical protein